MTDYSPEVATAIAELGDVHLPEEIRLLEVAGRGSRSIVFKATYRGETVALKVYRPEAIEKYRKKYELNIAVFEMSQNRKFRKVPELLPFSAKPIMVLGHDGKQSVCFMQAGLKELDLDYRDVMVRPQAGRWLPVIHDFNQVPSEHPANKAFMGLFKKGPRPNYEIVRDWASYSEECAG